jgi:hypothetical protein
MSNLLLSTVDRDCRIDMGTSRVDAVLEAVSPINGFSPSPKTSSANHNAGRLSGLAATQALAQLYGASRLYVNFFQPSFELKSKTRDGARVNKTYHAPATPCDRLLASPRVSEAVKSALKEQPRTLQRRKAWRAEKAKDLILGQLRRATTVPAAM